MVRRYQQRHLILEAVKIRVLLNSGSEFSKTCHFLPATPLHVHTFGTFLSKQNQRNNHGSLKMEEKSQKSKETICLYRGSCVFYKGEFLELVGDFIFLCPGEKEGHQIGQTGA